MALTRFTIDIDGMTIEGEGVVQVTGAPAPDGHAAILEFLDSIDPQAVEQEALNRMGWGDNCQTAVAIQIMREFIAGQVTT